MSDQIYAVIDAHGLIVNRIVGAVPGHQCVPEDDTPLEIGGSYIDGVYTPPPPRPPDDPLSEEQIVSSFRSAIQSHIDAVAQSHNYDGGTSLASYVASTNPTWAAEAQSFIAWRDAVWTYAYAELDKVTSGQREVPTVEDFIAELPAMEWPS